MSAHAGARPPILRRLDEFPFQQKRDWVIEGLLEVGGAALLIGAEGSGKSALSVAIVRSIVSGEKFFDLPVRQGTVVFIATEKPHESELRLRAALSLAEIAKVRFAERIDLFDVTLAQRIKDEVFAAFGEDPVLVVVDTAGAAMGDGDENSVRDVKRLCDAIDNIRRATGAAVLVVHHAKRNEKSPGGSKRPRGSQFFPAWADAVISISQNGSRHTFEVMKSNTSALTRNKIPFRIEGMPLDADDPYGDSVAVAVPCGGDGPSMTTRPILAGDALAALGALRALAPNGDPISLNEWRQECAKAWNKPNDHAFRQAWSALKNPQTSRLLRENWIVIEDESVRLVRRQKTSVVGQEPDGAEADNVSAAYGAASTSPAVQLPATTGVRRQEASESRQEPDGVSVSVSSPTPLGWAATADGPSASAPKSTGKSRAKPASVQTDLFGSGSL